MALGLASFDLFVRFCIFFQLPRKLPPKPEGVGSVEITSSGKLLCSSEHSQFFLKKFSSSEKSVFWFLSAFLNFMKLIKKYPPIFRVLGSIQRTGGGKLSCLRDYTQVFRNKNLWSSEKSKFCFCYRFSKLFDFSLFAWLFANAQFLFKKMVFKKVKILKLRPLFRSFLSPLENTVPNLRLNVQSRNPILGVFSF